MRNLIALALLSLTMSCGNGGGGATTIPNPSATGQQSTDGVIYDNNNLNNNFDTNEELRYVRFDFEGSYTFCAGGAFTVTGGQTMTLQEAQALFSNYALDRDFATQIRGATEIERTYLVGNKHRDHPTENQYTFRQLGAEYNSRRNKTLPSNIRKVIRYGE